ncbi:TetR/AcrR family transcriptional regulator [Mesoterricola silvestris]|uniref:TetR family transcriptional regulator n=1 Tax=Mesoterricola silvestris TaxID=2927979 RepID=A0AA48GR35_9BACT|nr:TetR/AcrR family transcriptional regulator [Mesoterricola silvestris]BDU74155.1 TetR family transcriptional regulator [Mesoterricola silvestris]
MPTRPPANPVKARDAAATRKRILAAVGTLLSREGFGALGVNAVAREAGVDKVLIYRYFGGIDQLTEAWASEMDFWPSVEEIVGDSPEPEPAALAAGMLIRHLQALRKRPLTLEVMAWEAVERHPLTRVLDRVREARSGQLMEALPEHLRGRGGDLPAVSALLGAGLQHLLLRARTVERYNGVPLGSPEGWERIEAAVHALCEGLLGRTESRR